MSQETILLLVNAFVGVIGKPAVDWLKGVFGIDGKLAYALTLIVSIILGAIATFAAGAFTGDVTTVEQIAEGAAVVFAVASTIFKAFQKAK